MIRLATPLLLLASTALMTAPLAARPRPAATAAAPAAAMQASPFDGMAYRLVGPFRGGRATGVAGSAQQPSTFYAGMASGGLWKTTDSGVTWKPLWDNFDEASPSVGGVAVAPSNPDIVYAGTGEPQWRGNVMAGNGLYKSTDAGKSWRFSGLRDTKSIARVIVDPANPNRLFVAAMGDPFADNPERGIYRSLDGGATWQKMLYVDAKTGAIDVQFDPGNPNVLYAGMWQAHRKPWIMESGGPGSGLYKSTDGGNSWQRLSGNGLPTGIMGRIGVAPTSDPKRVYALIEADKGGLYRSDDGGRSWALINGDNRYRQRAWYYTHVFADPKDPNKVFVLNTGAYKSSDGGKSFTTMPTFHGDNHALWINPENPDLMVNANDGGANVSVNGGESWTDGMNQPTAQFYHVTIDRQFPYTIYGAQQDNSTVAISSADPTGPIGGGDLYAVGGGESGYVAPWPRDPNIVISNSYGGQVTRFDRRTGQSFDISPWPRLVMGWAPKLIKHRAQWTEPLVFSPHDPDTLYHVNEVVFRSRNLGQSWEVISPDLTRNDKSKQEPTGGPITKDTTSVETYGTIFTFAESPVEKGLLWAGTDDGVIQVSRDNGARWRNVTPKAMPEWGTVSMVEPDPRRAGTVYVAVDRHRLSDDRPHAFRSDDYGASWTAITGGFPADATVRVIRADPVRDGLLYAGTETGVFISFDRGARWQPLRLNLPRVPVHDLAIAPNDLVVGTHGRSFWVLDDLSALRQWTPADASRPLTLYAPKATPRFRIVGRGNGTGRFNGMNPPTGLVVYYKLAEAATGPVRIEILDSEDRLIRKFESDNREAAKAEAKEKSVEAAVDAKTPRPAQPDPAEKDQRPDAAEAAAKAMRPNVVTGKAGLNRFIWDMRYAGAADIARAPLWAGSTAGPIAMPGQYRVRVTANGVTQTQDFTLAPDPRPGAASVTALRSQLDLGMKVVADLDRVQRTILEIRNLHREVARLRAAHPQDTELAAAATTLDAEAVTIEETLIQRKSVASQDPLNYPVQLNNMIASLNRALWQADGEPTAQHRTEYEELKTLADARLGQWATYRATKLATFNALLQRKGIDPIAPTAEAEMKADPFKPARGDDDAAEEAGGEAEQD